MSLALSHTRSIGLLASRSLLAASRPRQASSLAFVRLATAQLGSARSPYLFTADERRRPGRTAATPLVLARFASSSPQSQTQLSPPRSQSSSTATQTTTPKAESQSSLSSPAQAVAEKKEETGKESSSSTKALATPKEPLMKRLWISVKDGAIHYWHGTKLLGKEVSISARLLKRVMSGYTLTRREHRQLKRTMQDLLRLIPFIPFIIIPLGELLLPVAIKVFPNMLPSTFEDKFAAEEKKRKLLKVRLQMAKFLQETIRESGIKASAMIKNSEEFKEFFRKVRATGEEPNRDDIIKVAKLFEDDLTLDNLSRPQLVSMCRYMGINAFGTDNYLRYQIRHRLTTIRRDDIAIATEGVDSLTIPELQSACQSRGIQTVGLSPARLREELEQWIDLHVRTRISGTLLILSKAFNYGHQDDSHLKSLEATLSSLPDTLLNEAELEVSPDSATYKQKLEVLEQQEDLIEEERGQEAKEEEARKAEKEKEREREAQKEKETPEAEKEEEKAKEMKPEREEVLPEEDARMTKEQLHELGEACAILSAKSAVLKEREELAHLMNEVVQTEEGEQPQQPQEQEDKQKAAKAEGGEAEAAPPTSQTAAQRSLAKRVRVLLEKIDKQLEEYDKEFGNRMNTIQTNEQGQISVEDLKQALRVIRHRPAEEEIEKLVKKLDIDHDGLVPLDHVLDLAREEIGLGIVRTEDAKDIAGQGKQLLKDGEVKEEERPRKEDIVKEEHK